MEPLKLFATIQIHTSQMHSTSQMHKLLDDWKYIFSRKGWHAAQHHDQLVVESHGFHGSLEESEPGLLILRGDVENLATADQLTAIFRDQNTYFQIDIFEEDGRLLRRLTNETP